jgi:hypothetical protein
MKIHLSTNPKKEYPSCIVEAIRHRFESRWQLKSSQRLISEFERVMRLSQNHSSCHFSFSSECRAEILPIHVQLHLSGGVVMVQRLSQSSNNLFQASWYGSRGHVRISTTLLNLKRSSINAAQLIKEGFPMNWWHELWGAADTQPLPCAKEVSHSYSVLFSFSALSCRSSVFYAES